MPAQDKTERATPKKRRDERKKGNTFQSKDVVSAVSILAVFVVLDKMFPYIYRYMSNFLAQYFNYIKTINDFTSDDVRQIFLNGIIALFIMAGPVMIASIASGIIATGVQTKFIFSRESMKMKFSRLNPIEGIKKLVSVRSFFELFKSLVKFAIIFVVMYIGYKDITADCIKLMSIDIMSAVIFILKEIYNLVIKLCICFFAIAAFDYLFQRFDYEKNIKMTKQEVKEEYRHTEGDPLIKGRIRDTQRRMATMRMMQNVAKADVIVRNPTHFAIALQYDIDKNGAPIVVAKGQDYVALRIIEEAKKYDIPMMEDKPLARALYNEVNLNCEIPPQYYSVMAEILAWVYSLKKKDSLKKGAELV